MKKKILVAAIGAVVAGGMASVAQADVSVGGMAQVEVAKIKMTTGSATTEGTTAQDNARGRMWVTASEDLGDGMKGIALFEFSTDTTGVVGFDSVSGTPNTREKYVGLASPFGTIKLGSVRSPYKYAGGVLWDAFVTTTLEARGNGGMFKGNFGQGGFLDQSINYTSPTVAGLNVGVAYGLANSNAGLAGGTADAGDSSIAVEWKGMGLDVVLARAHNKNPGLTGPGAGSKYVDNTKAGVRYGISGINLAFQYEKQKGTGGATANADANDYFVSVSANVGKLTPAVQIGKLKKKSVAPLMAGTVSANGAASLGAVTGTADYMALGAFYNFSKTFSAFAGYGQNKIKPDGGTETKNTVYTVGLRKIF